MTDVGLPRTMFLGVGRRRLPEAHKTLLMLPIVFQRLCHLVDVHTPRVMRVVVGRCCLSWSALLIQCALATDNTTCCWTTLMSLDRYATSDACRC